MRYLDSNEMACPSLKRLLRQYKSRSAGKFGFWLNTKHKEEFNRAYDRWWLQHPELFGKIYEGLDCNRMPSYHTVPAA